jgi:hypothetical protein
MPEEAIPPAFPINIQLYLEKVIRMLFSLDTDPVGSVPKGWLENLYRNLCTICPG